MIKRRLVIPLTGFRLGIIILICVICGLFSLGAKSCVNRNGNKAKSGSSDYNTFVINAPSNLSATAVSSSQINLSWQDNSNNEDGFEIERRTQFMDYVLLVTVGQNVTSYLDMEISSGLTYYYRVRSFNTIGDRSAYSNETMVNIRGEWTTVVAGYFYSAALRSDNTIWVWGDNTSGQLGLGDYAPLTITILTQMGTDADWSKIAAGYWHMLGIKNNNTLWSWGSNDSGQLGLGITDDYRTEPAQIGTDSDWSAITGGANHTIGGKTNGTIWAWGANSGLDPEGNPTATCQLGLGDSDDRNTPTQIGTESDWVSITAGASHNIARKNNGNIWGWGWNIYYQLGLDYNSIGEPLTQIGTDSDWSMVGATYSNTIACKTNGTIWLSTGTGPLVQFRNDTDWSFIGTGGDSSYLFAIKTNGTLWQVNNAMDPPNQIGTDSDWSIVSVGYRHVLACKNNGSIWVWGWNNYGQLGLGDTIDREIPYQLGSPAPPLSLIANVVSSQVNLSWSDNSNNELGFKVERKTGADGTYEQIAILGQDAVSYSNIGLFPGTYYYRVRAYNIYGNSTYSNEIIVVIQDISTRWVMVAVGDIHSLGIKANGSLWAWGDNSGAQLGHGYTLVPDLVTTVISPTRIDLSWTDNFDETALIVEKSYATLSDYYRILPPLNCNVTSYSATVEQGYDYDFRVWAYSSPISTTTRIGTDIDWSIVTAKYFHTLAIKTNNTLWGWGYNRWGQLGLGESGLQKYSESPTQVGTSSDWRSISTSGNSSGCNTVAIKNNRSIWAWGNNAYGQLGLEDNINRNTPTQIGTLSDWSLIVAGVNHTIALKLNGTIWGWGDNSPFGQLGLGGGPNRNIPTPIGSTSDWAIITAGGSHTLARKNNGTLWSCGLNINGQLGLGIYDLYSNVLGQINNSDWSICVAGDYHNIGFKTNGTLWAWGNNGGGQLGLGDPGIVGNSRYTPSQIGINSDWISGSAGSNHTIAINADGNIWSWGQNDYGQLGVGGGGNRNTPTLVGE
jgi:alpha-tubulin suppressor-like RCC1 family protein